MNNLNDVFDLNHEDSWDQGFEEFDHSVGQIQEEEKREKELAQKKIEEELRFREELIASFRDLLMKHPVNYNTAGELEMYLKSIRNPEIVDILMDNYYLLKIREILESVDLDRKCYKELIDFYEIYRDEINKRNLGQQIRIYRYLKNKKKQADDQEIAPFCWWKYGLILLLPVIASLGEGQWNPLLTAYEVGLVILHCALYRFFRRNKRLAYSLALPVPLIFALITCFAKIAPKDMLEQSHMFNIGYVDISIGFAFYAFITWAAIKGEDSRDGHKLDLVEMIQKGEKWKIACGACPVVGLISILFGLILKQSDMGILFSLLGGMSFLGAYLSISTYITYYRRFLEVVDEIRARGKGDIIYQFQGVYPQIGQEEIIKDYAKIYFGQEGFFVMPNYYFILYDEIKSMKASSMIMKKNRSSIEFEMKDGKKYRNIKVPSNVVDSIYNEFVKPHNPDVIYHK